MWGCTYREAAPYIHCTNNTYMYLQKTRGGEREREREKERKKERKKEKEKERGKERVSV